MDPQATILSLSSLDLVELEAFVELMFLAAFADGEVSAEERATFRGQLVKGTAGQLQEGLVDLVVAEVERRTAAFDRDAKLAEIRRRLKDPRKRHAALVHAAGVVLADGVLALDEVAFLRRASAALGEREAAAEEIIAEARAAR
jgi:uncharacterized tellurite resistance protein B-like protein